MASHSQLMRESGGLDPSSDTQGGPCSHGLSSFGLSVLIWEMGRPRHIPPLRRGGVHGGGAWVWEAVQARHAAEAPPTSQVSSSRANFHISLRPGRSSSVPRAPAGPPLGGTSPCSFHRPHL